MTASVRAQSRIGRDAASIVSDPEKAGGKPKTRKRDWTKARELTRIVQCTIK